MLNKLYCCALLSTCSIFFDYDYEFLKDYCEFRVDEISYTLSHDMYLDEFERHYNYGVMMGLEEVLSIMRDIDLIERDLPN